MNWSPASMNAIRDADPPAQLEAKDPAVELQRLIDVTDLEGDVVDPDQLRLSHSSLLRLEMTVRSAFDCSQASLNVAGLGRLRPA